MSQADLARMVGASPPAIQQILSGKTKRSRLVSSMARVLGVSEAWLTGESDSPFEVVSGSMTPDELVKQLRVRLSGGAVFGQIDDDGHKPEFLNDLFDPDWLVHQISKFDPTISDIDDEDFVPPVLTIPAGTDAMAPTINKGDQVTVSLWNHKVDQADAIWYISYGGLRMIRRLMPLPIGGFRVSGDNPNSPTFEAPAHDVRIIGRAFWVGRPLS